MEAMSKIFAWIFTVMTVLLLIAAIAGATHQFTLAAICGFMALVMWNEIKKE